MPEDTNAVRPRAARQGGLDATDRRLLGLLAQDAGQSYAALGQQLNLSPPAVHERVRRLRRDGAILGTVARIAPAALGRELLAFVHVTTSAWGVTEQILALSALPQVEEIHSATGEACLILKLRTAGPRELEQVLARIYQIPHVLGTRSTVVLNTYLERGPVP